MGKQIGSALEMKQIAGPAVPATGANLLYFKADGLLYKKDAGGTETPVNTGSSGEPVITPGTTAQYWRGDKTWQTLNSAAVALGSVDNTADTAKPVSTAQQTALNLKANLAGPTFTGTVAGITAAMVGLGSVDNTADTAKPVSTAQQTALNLKANLAGPTFTGTVAGITAAMVGLGSVDNTADTAKPVSTAQQTALNLKANLAGPTFTGTVAGITAAMVGLGSVDNTADTAKPVSTAQQTALNAKEGSIAAGSTGKEFWRGDKSWQILDLTDLPNAWVKKTVRLATAVGITYPYSGLPIVDGVQTVAGDRILTKNQVTTSQHGVWIAAAGTWARATDADSALKMAGATVYVDQGTQAGQIWTNEFFSTDTLGTTLMPWYRNLDTAQVQNAKTTATVTDSTAAYVTTGMQVNVVAGKTYHFKARGQYQSAVLTTGIGFRIGGTCTATSCRSEMIVYGVTATGINFRATNGLNVAGVASTDVAAINTDYPWTLEGEIRVATSGTLRLDFKSEIAATVVTLVTDATLIVTEL